MEPDGGGVLRGLPRSRPGTRSSKRAGAAAPPPADNAPAEKQEPDDPVGDAVRAATGAALAGLRAADAVTREVLRRLPRP
jgi:hypothetical protein